MAGVFLLNVLDVARALGATPLSATPERVAVWLLSKYVRKRGGGFNYNTSIHTVFDLFKGAISCDEAIRYCMTTGSSAGRRHNADAVKQIAPYALDNISNCYRIGFAAIAVGRIGDQTIYVGIKAPMVRVVHREAFVVMPGFRMSHRPVEAEIDIACSIALANFARDDFVDADFEYLYAGPGASGERDFRAIRGRDRTVYDRGTVDALLDTYVKGVALALEGGVNARKPNLQGYRIIDPREPSFF